MHATHFELVLVLVVVGWSKLEGCNNFDSERDQLDGQARREGRVPPAQSSGSKPTDIHDWCLAKRRSTPDSFFDQSKDGVKCAESILAGFGEDPGVHTGRLVVKPRRPRRRPILQPKV